MQLAVDIIRFIKLCQKDEKLLSLLESLSVEVGIGKNFGISHVDNYVMYSLESDEVEIMIEADDYSIENLTTSATFHVTSFKSAAKSALTEL